MATHLAFTPKEDHRDRIQIEVGDSKQPDFIPQVKLMRWDNEVNFSVRYIDTEGNNTYYDVEDGYEFEVIFNEKPASNVVRFSVQSKGLDFFYQPELTPEEIAEGAIRPDNVIGSYAVYHSQRPKNIIDGKLYKSGKAFHIYRPFVEDDNGDRIWADLDITGGMMTITIDQNWLDNAAYPVVVDPTFGYYEIGGTSTYGAPIYATKYTLSEAGSISSVVTYGDKQTSGTATLYAAIYDTSYNLLDTEDSTGSKTTTAAWDSIPITYSASATDYFIAWQANTNISRHYDTGDTAQSFFKSTTIGSWPDPVSGQTDLARMYSVYAVYTPTYTGTNEDLYVDGDGNDTSGWRAEGGDYTRVDDTTPDGDTTRLYTPTADDLASFTIDNTSAGASDTINAVWVYAYVKSVDPVDSTFQIYVRTNSTNYYSSTLTGHSSLGYHEYVVKWATNPDTASAWTTSEINALEIGVKKINTAGQAVTMMKAVVDYTASATNPEPSVNDSITITESATVTVNGPTPLSQDTSDSVTVTESSDVAVTSYMNVSDTATITESVSVSVNNVVDPFKINIASYTGVRVF